MSCLVSICLNAESAAWHVFFGLHEKCVVIVYFFVDVYTPKILLVYVSNVLYCAGVSWMTCTSAGSILMYISCFLGVRVIDADRVLEPIYCNFASLPHSHLGHICTTVWCEEHVLGNAQKRGHVRTQVICTMHCVCCAPVHACFVVRSLSSSKCFVYYLCFCQWRLVNLRTLCCFVCWQLCTGILFS